VILKINEDGNELDEKLLSGLYFYEYGTAMELENTHSGGYVLATEPRNGGKVWLRKWGGSEETMNIKISPGGLGSQSLDRTNDNGFIISTMGSTVIKTDSNLSYRYKYLHKVKSEKDSIRFINFLFKSHYILL